MISSKDITSRGRVIVQLGERTECALAMEMAVHLARISHSHIQSLFVEDEGLIALAGMPFAHEISASSGLRRRLTPGLIEQEMALTARALRRQAEQAAMLADVELSFEVVRGEVAQSLDRAAREALYLVLGEPVGRFMPTGLLASLIEALPPPGGLVLYGPEAGRAGGSIIAALESRNSLKTVGSVAARLAKDACVPLILLPVGEKAPDDNEIADMARSLQVASFPVRIARSISASTGDAAAVVQRVRGGLLIAEFGVGLVATEKLLKTAAELIECPLLIIQAPA